MWDKGNISDMTKSFVLSEMRAIDSLEHTLDVLTRLFNMVWGMVENIEEILGENKKSKALCLLLKL
ncbi:hypothetical protein BDV29DRAFT_179016 [Aspergillus leporis]|jgi:hypothetical protein|uniref:Uncharacterized protein n=1 Tax=Aspergillus leporis TaxID=41062 RepID=A0A5N5WSR4_9EURO|nr:hypothetical protein BDV29DRAFT_179016 [Aspergillus leporis]